MHWWGSGFVPIIIYAGSGSFVESQHVLLTENNFDILTEDSKELLIET